MGDLRALGPILRCPVCGGAMSVGAGVDCTGGHHFDIARQGYVNLLNRAAPDHADTADMVAARRRVLETGSFDRIAEALLDRCPESGVLVDAGAGPGWYARTILTGRPCLRGLALDVSVPAVRIAARAHQRLAAVVADTWQQLPVVDCSVDVLTCVFAPRNIGEFARVLRPDGRLLVITPRSDHLIELRESGAMLGIGENKLADLDGRLADRFAVIDRTPIVTRHRLTAGLAADLIAMGPSAFHADRQAPADLPSSITVAVDLTVAAPLGSRGG